MKRFTLHTERRLRAAPACRCMTITSALVAAMVALVCVGCGKSPRVAVYPTEGRVLRAGKPLAGATVVFYPQGNSDKAPVIPRALTDAGGRYRLSTYESGDGAPEGQYVVTVVHYPLQQQAGGWTAGANTLPPKYAGAKTSDLRVQVKQGENVLPPLKLSADRRLSNNREIPSRGKES